MKKKTPPLKTGEAAADFGTVAELSDHDHASDEPARFEFEKKAARINMRLPEKLLEAVKKRASARGIPYQRFIRETLERAVTQPHESPRPRPRR